MIYSSWIVFKKSWSNSNFRDPKFVSQPVPDWSNQMSNIQNSKSFFSLRKNRRMNLKIVWIDRPSSRWETINIANCVQKVSILLATFCIHQSFMQCMRKVLVINNKMNTILNKKYGEKSTEKIRVYHRKSQKSLEKLEVNIYRNVWPNALSEWRVQRTRNIEINLLLSYCLNHFWVVDSFGKDLIKVYPMLSNSHVEISVCVLLIALEALIWMRLMKSVKILVLHQSNHNFCWDYIMPRV